MSAGLLFAGSVGVLIVPSGIETYYADEVLQQKIVLIVPSGIETETAGSYQSSCQGINCT